MNKNIKKTNNSDMENLYFLIPLFFIVILVIPIFVSVKCAVNIQKKDAIISLFLWKIKIKTTKAYIKGTKIYISSSKVKEMSFSFSSKSVLFMEQLMTNLKDKVTPKKICVYSKIGLGDAKQTATFCGGVITLVKSFFCYIKNKKPTCGMDCIVFPDYKKESQIYCFYASISITLFDVLFSVIVSLFNLRRYYGKQSKLS